MKIRIDKRTYSLYCVCKRCLSETESMHQEWSQHTEDVIEVYDCPNCGSVGSSGVKVMSRREWKRALASIKLNEQES